MKRIDLIISHPDFIESMRRNAKAEATRIYCKHDITHSLDVARIAYIISLESGHIFPQELIYAAALLHDITRWKQYLDGTPHNESAVEPAANILRDCDFSKTEIATVCDAVLHHRNDPLAGDNNIFSNLIYRADKLSRPCYSCKSADSCKRSEDMRNFVLEV